MASEDELGKLSGGFDLHHRSCLQARHVHPIHRCGCRQRGGCRPLPADAARADGLHPPCGGWAAQYKTVAYLVAAILESRATREVLELGGGVSTIWMGLALKKRGYGHLTTLDHDAAYAERTQRLVTAHGLQGFVEVVHAPLVEQQVGDCGAMWYDIGELPESLPPVDLLFVDGPPATDDPTARLPAFGRFCSTLVDGATVILDDVNRVGEQQILESWTSSGSCGGRLIPTDHLGRSDVLEFAADHHATRTDQPTS